MQLLLIVFLVLVFIQIIYLGLFFIAFSQTKVGEEAPLAVSVIVCAHDEEQNLRQLLPILLTQDYPLYEVIIVEDRSNDGSFDFLHNYNHPKLRIVRVADKPEHIAGKKFALTLGVKAAKYDWVLLTDADCRPKSNQWIKEMSRYFSSQTSIVLGYSPYEKSSGLLNSFIRYETLLTAIQFLGMALMGKPYMGVGRNLAYRKDLFLKNKGFNSHLGIIGGDDDLFVNETCDKRNVAVCMGAASVVYSKPKLTWAEYFIQKIRHLAVGKRYKLSDKIRLGLFNISLVGVWVLAVPSMIYSPFIYLPVGALVLRSIMITWLANRASRRLGEPFEAWKAPFLDFIFSIYYLVTGLVALQTNKIRWKKI